MRMSKSDVLPFIAMVVVQIVFAGMNIISKLAMDSGLKPLVLVVYRQVLATITMVPLAYFFERKTLPNITKAVIFRIFVCSLLGTSANQILYLTGLKYSSPTIGCALANLLPAFTFILGIVFRQEYLVRRVSCLAKVIGTVLCVGGAMLLSFYHGRVISTAHSGLDMKLFVDPTQGQAHNSRVVLGCLLIIASCLCWAGWFTLQARLSKDFPAPYTTTLMMSFMGSITCASIGVSTVHRFHDWSLHSPATLITVLYSGMVCTAVGYSLTCWSIQRKGALYVSVFIPLQLVIVAITSFVLLREKLYVGIVVGSMLIICGLYSVLWGKHGEAKVKMVEEIKDTAKPDKEDHLESHSLGNLNANPPK